LDNRADRAGTARHCLLQFIDPRAHFAEGNILEIRGTYPSAQHNNMSQLNFKQAEYFGFANVESPTIKTAELVLIYPKNLGALQMMSHPTRSTRRDEKLISYDRDYRLALGEKLDVVGFSVSALEPGETLCAHVTQLL
jgi:hypothetical protein